MYQQANEEFEWEQFMLEAKNNASEADVRNPLFETQLKVKFKF
jgi:hypothetical protein